MTGESTNDEGASPEDDIKQQNPGGETTGDIADGDEDPHKVERLTKQDRAGDPDEGSE